MFSPQFKNWFLNLNQKEVVLYREWVQLLKSYSEEDYLNANINFNLNKQEELIATITIENQNVQAFIQDKIQIFNQNLRQIDKVELDRYCQYNIQKYLLRENMAKERQEGENQLYSNQLLQGNSKNLVQQEIFQQQQQEEFKQSEFQLKKENSSKNLEVIFKQKNCLVTVKSEVKTILNPSGYTEQLAFREFMNKNSPDENTLVNEFEVQFQETLIKIKYSYKIVQTDKTLQNQNLLIEKSPSIKVRKTSNSSRKMKNSSKRDSTPFKLQPLMSSSSENQLNLQENGGISPVMACTDFMNNTGLKEIQQQRKFTEDIMFSQDINNNNNNNQQQQQEQKMIYPIPTQISQLITQETASTQKHQKQVQQQQQQQQQQQINDCECNSNQIKINIVKQFDERNKKLQFAINKKEEKKQLNLTDVTMNDEISESFQQQHSQQLEDEEQLQYSETKEKNLLRTPVAYHHKKTGHSNAGSSSKKPDKKNVVKNFVKAFRVYLKKLKEDKKSEDNFPVQTYEQLCDLVQDFEDFEQNRNYNNGLIIEISSSNKFKDVWRYFLQYHAAEWLRTSGVQDKEAHREVLQQYIKSLENPQELNKITVLRKGQRKNSQV